MASPISSPTLKSWLADGQELALLDVRESGEFGEGHLFHAVPLPYSRLEAEIERLVPRKTVRLVLLDDGASGVAGRAAKRAAALGYSDIHILDGGTAGWTRAGFTLFKGVNLPSKTFGELVEHKRHTPRITAPELKARIERGDDLVIVDGRPLAEHRKMTIPGSTCCPNGELAVRIRALAPDPRTTVVVNCAGRTRSIIGAQTLIDLGLPNPVMALENGTQGWFLSGFALEHGSTRRYPEARDPSHAKQARTHAERHGVRWIEAATATSWFKDAARTAYLLDVRTAEEFASGHLPGAVHAPGGQLVQATDQWVGVRHARLLLVDDDGVRAPMIAAWLRQMGHDAYVLDGRVAAASASIAETTLPVLPAIEPRALATQLATGTIRALDLRPSQAYRRGHSAGSQWAIRPRLALTLGDYRGAVALIADETMVARAAAADLRELGVAEIVLLDGGFTAWRQAGLRIDTSVDEPRDAECIDYLFFTHDRHDGNAEAARQYLAWETGLLDQLDAQERASFRI